MKHDLHSQERQPCCLYVVLSVNRDPSRRYLEFDRTEDHRGEEREPKWIIERDGIRLLEFPSPEAHAAAQAEVERLTKIEHAAWHLLDDSEHRVEPGEIVVTSAGFDALSNVLSEEHPETKVAALEAERDELLLKVPAHVCVVCQSEADPSVWPDDGSGPKCEPCVALAAALDALEGCYATMGCSHQSDRLLRRRLVVSVVQSEVDELKACMAARAVLTANNRRPR